MGKNSSDEIVNEIVNLKVKDGKTHIFILKYLKEHYGYANAFAYELIQRANEQITEIHKNTISGIFEIRIQEYDQQRQEALEVGDKRLWANLTDKMNQLQGLYIERTEVTQTIIEVKRKSNE